MDNRLTPEQEVQLEDALKSYPLAPMPRSITMDVMARIQKDTRPALITWNDFVLSLVIAVCIGALFFAVQNLPPVMLMKIRIQGILLYQDFLVNARWLVPALMFGLATLLSALTIPYLAGSLRRSSK
jgi:Na+/H+ antiporter NhaC